MLQDLLGCEALVGVHMQHLGHQVLGKSRQGGWWERLAGSRVLGLANGDWLRQTFPAISRLDPCSSPCNPFSTLLQGLLEWHMPFLGVSSWKALSLLFHHLEAMQEGGKNRRLGLGRIKT